MPKNRSPKPPIRTPRKETYIEAARTPIKEVITVPGSSGNMRHLATEALFKTVKGANFNGGWVIVPDGPTPTQGMPRDGHDTIGTVPSTGHTADGIQTGGVINHQKIQADVGGTKGTPRPVDRSSANKKGWETRKKIYGSSGRKGS